MKKIKLKESDIENLVKKIIKEEQMEMEFGNAGHDQEEMNNVWRGLNDLNDDEIFDLMELTFNEDKMSVESFIDHLPTHMGYERDYLVSVLKQIQDEGI
jgi:hypothetical protein